MAPDMSRALPVKIRPRHLETSESYGRRLALANGLPADTPLKAARQLAGTSKTSALRSALTQWSEAKGGLRTGHFQRQAQRANENLPARTMCRLCAHGEIVGQFGHAESYACLRHGLWTGPQTDAPTLTPINDRVRSAEIRYRRLRRAGRVPIILVQELAIIVSRHRGVSSIKTRLDAANYSDVVHLAQLLTSQSFQRDLLQPTRTFAQARHLLETSLLAQLPSCDAVLVDGLWLLLRPAFLAVRDEVENRKHPAPAICQLLDIDPGIWASMLGIPRPMEPFNRYLDVLETSPADSWVNACELLLVSGQNQRPRAASKQGAWTASIICRRGHWSQRTMHSAFKTLKAGRDGCPYCAGSRALAGYNSMAETHPNIAAQWHPTLNGDTVPSHITRAGTSPSYWWICSSGHEWQASPGNRTKGQGCPYCSRRRCTPGVTSLDVTHPSIAAEWNYRLNGDKVPSMITSGSGAVIEWICPRAHEYATTPAARTGRRGVGCPVCANARVLAGANDLATSHPHIAKEWHPSRNGAVTPQTVGAGTPRKYYWRCQIGHDYLSPVNARTRGTGCPACAGQQVIAGYNDLLTTHPHVAAEWDHDANGSRTPDSVISGSARKAYWICPLGHKYAKPINARAAGSACQYCSNRKVLSGFNDLATRYPELTWDWHPEKNGSIVPDGVVPGNTQRWWKCADGHEQFGSVPNRIRTGGCSQCPPERRVLDREAGAISDGLDVDRETHGDQ